MEILIIGGVVVLIMVFISTQIKKSAAQAFERETIETADFTIVKPNGFLYPLREDSEYLFEAYSKEYGEREERNFWKAQVYLTASPLNSTESVGAQIEQAANKVVSKKLTENAAKDETVCLLETEKIEDEIEFGEFWKIVKSRQRQKTYDLQIKVLKSSRDEFLERIDELTNSFQLK